MSAKTHYVSCHLRNLISGNNGTGIASLVAVEDVSRSSGERKDIAKCFLNVGDSTQRFCIENKIKLSRVNCIVLSSLAPCYTSGIVGVLLCLSDLGAGAVAIVGPPGTAGIVHNLGPFVNKKYPVITVHEIGVNGCTDPVRLELGAYEVRAMPIFVQGSQSAVGVAAAVLCGRGEFCCGCVPVTDRFKTAPTTEQAMNWMKSLSCSIVCAVPLVVSPSGLGEDFCSKLGDLFREFKLFGVITKNNRSGGVCEVEQPQLSIALHGLLLPALFPPTMPALVEVLTDRQFSAHWKESTSEETGLDKYKCSPCAEMRCDGDFIESYPNAIVMSPSGGGAQGCVFTTLSFQTSSGSFDNFSAMRNNKKTIMEYLASKICLQGWQVCGQAANPIAYADVRAGNFSLSIDDGDFDSPAVTYDTKTNGNSKSSLAVNCSCDTLVKEGVLRLGSSFCPYCTYSAGSYYTGGLCGNEAMCPPDPRDPIVTFLGTGCATPSRHRSNSAILLKTVEINAGVSVDWSLLMDAGESVCCQLYHDCGCDLSRYHRLLLSIRVIWISHHHADHHAGLLFLLSELWRIHMLHADKDWYKEQWAARHCESPLDMFAQRVQVIAPSNVLLYTEYCVCVAAIEEIFNFVDIINTKAFGVTSAPSTWARGPLTAPLLSIPVEHCRNSHGLVLELRRASLESFPDHSTADDGPIKIVFSGDCRPSESLVRAGYGCTLLIHEATFDDTMQEDARNKRHSTTTEALHIAQCMSAKHVILTHFSQRYSKLISHQPLTGIDLPYTNAIDFLHVAVPSQLPKLPQAMDMLISAVFSDSVYEGEDPTSKCCK